MSKHFSADSLNQIHSMLMKEFSNGGWDYESAPRGKPIRELIAASFTLTNPRNRIISSPARNVNYGFAVGELCWYIRGDTDLQTMLYYNKRMDQFSDDGKTINSAYGNRMFRSRWGDGFSQFDNVVEELKKDPDSRRAVMHINEWHDLDHANRAGSKDVPCTMSIQLLIRDRKLHMHVLMRSNDVVWGMPYDVFSFTCLQETFLHVLRDEGVEVDDLGSYHHSAGSLHIYDTHFDMAREVSLEVTEEVPQMKPIDIATLEYMVTIHEPAIRNAKTHRELDLQYPAVALFESDYAIIWMTDKLIDHARKRLEENYKKSADGSGSSIQAEFCGNVTEKKEL